MKKTYEKPEMEWIEFDKTEMIICDSADNDSPFPASLASTVSDD